MITESLRFPQLYNWPGHTLTVTRNDGDITLELESTASSMTLPACEVMDEITPTATPYIWCVWIDLTPVRVAESDAKAIQRMVERAISGGLPAI